MRAETKRLVYTQQAPTEEELKFWKQSAPYFVLPAAMALKRSDEMPEQQRDRLLARVAIQASDREALYDLIGDEEARFANFYPDRREPTTTTESTIDTFLETFGRGNQRETEALTRMIFNPTPSYEATLAAEANGMDTRPALAHDHPESDTTTDEVEEPETVETVHIKASNSSQTGNLSESFAKIMIKNGNYDKALEIITGLSLNNPKKSIYFADQIRFLKKLIINKKRQ